MPEKANPTIAHIKDHFLPRSETFIFTQIIVLRRYRSIVLNRHSRQNPDEFSVERHYSPIEQFGPLGSVLERACLHLLGHSPFLESIIRAENVQLLHAHFGQLGALFSPVARRRHLPLVTSFYGKDISVFAANPAWKRRFEALWQHGWYFTVLGPNMAERLRVLGCPGERVVVVPLAVDARQFAFAERRPPSRGEPVRILTVGRLVPKKGMDVLLYAMAMLKRTHPIRLWIAGDGPQRIRLECLAAQLGLSEMVVFLGWVKHSEIADCMAQAHLFTLASRTDPETEETEGTPAVLLEAQARGLPIVSTYHADIPSIVRDGEAGVLVPEGDVDALATALDELLHHPERWAALGRAGHAFVESQHGMHRVCARLEQIYDRCLERKESPRQI
jgi:colanic acid/amylovoran biosynthesis glycosyltransferase